MDQIPAPPGTSRRKVEYGVVGLAVVFCAAFLIYAVYWLGVVIGLWGSADVLPVWADGATVRVGR